MSYRRPNLPPRVATRQDPRDGADAVVMEATGSTPLAARRMQDGVPLQCCQGTSDNPPNSQVQKARPNSALSGSISRVPTGTLWVMKAHAQEPLANGADAETCRYLLSRKSPVPKLAPQAAKPWPGRPKP